MDDQLLTLSKIFVERLFRIPDYQRGYAWTEKQLKDFWSDIQQLEPGHNHYTGVLTLENVTEDTYRNWPDDYWIIDSKSYQPFYLVDGQQRLTTAIIVIQVISEKINENVKLNFTEKKDIQRKFIFDSKDNGISRSYIFGYEKDNPSYEYLKTKIFNENSSSALGEETLYTQNLEYAKNYFTQLIKPLDLTEIEYLYKKITQHLLFNIFTITEDVDVCVAFETMNNRGKPLSYLELLKNRLIYLSLKFNAAEYERRKLRTAINDCWKTIYHNLGRNKQSPLDDDRFLINHYIIYFGHSMFVENPAGDVRLRYRNIYRIDYATDLLEKRFIPKNVLDTADKTSRIKLADVYKYVSSLQDAVDTWYKIFNPQNSGFSHNIQIWLDKLNRLEVSLFHPMLLVFLQRKETEAIRLEFLKAIERFTFVSAMGFGRTLGHDMFYPEIEIDVIRLTIDLAANKISCEKLIKTISDETSKILKSQYFMPSVIRLFRERGFYQWDGLRYFLFEYNLSLQQASRTSRPKIFWSEFVENKTDFNSVEHIYPQQARSQYWTTRFNGFTQKQREALRNSLGNLLPLSRSKNSSLSNKPFPEKVDGNNSTVGYRFGSYAENEVTKQDEWTPKHILERGLTLLHFLERRWNIDIGDDRKKTQMLELEFLSKRH